MSERTNIDRLFQEKFKDFEVTPSDKVWDNIQSKMNTKEKKTNLLPFWLRLCSFAAVFLIGFSVATTFIAGPFGLKNPFINTKENASGSDKQNQANPSRSVQNTIVGTNDSGSINKETNTTNAVTETGNNSSDSNHTITSPNKNNITDKNAAASENNFEKHTVAGATKSSNSKRTLKGSSIQNTTAENSNALASGRSNKKTTTALSKEKQSEWNAVLAKESKKSTVKTAVVADTNPEATSKASTIASAETEDVLAEDLKIKNTDSDFLYLPSNSKVAYESGNKHIPNKKESKSVLNVSETEKAIAETNNAVAVAGKNKSSENKAAGNKSINNALSVVTDSLAQNKKEVAEKTEEKKAAEEKDSREKKETKSKWVVSSTFSPVYMNLNGSGSALDSKFAGNSKSYQTSMSYGVGVKYAINNKWSVRTGVNALNFEYNTNDITFYYSNNGAGLENVNENGTGSGIVIENPNPKGIAYNDDGMVTTRYKGNINHRINYIEVPMELSYKILNKKFGIDVIGGVSSMFLNDNRVSLVSSESNLNVGEANNLNKLHFSTNVGLGLRYNFMKTFQANIEPMFKYQINTYNGDAGNFKPYFMGVYSGISFSF